MGEVETYGVRLRREMEKEGITAVQLAEMLGARPQTVSSWRCLTRSYPPGDKMQKRIMEILPGMTYMPREEVVNAFGGGECELDLTEEGRMSRRIDPQDMDTEGCLKLAETILQEARQDYIHTRYVLMKRPRDANALHHLEVLRRWFLSDTFSALTGLDGKAVWSQMDAMAFKI